MGVGCQPHAPAALPPERDPLLIAQEAGWVLEPVWTGVENLAPTGIRSPDRPARSESLYRLSYPGSTSYIKQKIIYFFKFSYRTFCSMFWNYQQMHKSLLVDYFTQLLLHVSAPVCHPQGALLYLLSYMPIRVLIDKTLCNAWILWTILRRAAVTHVRAATGLRVSTVTFHKFAQPVNLVRKL
jgi:hypothetical protein